MLFKQRLPAAIPPGFYPKNRNGATEDTEITGGKGLMNRNPWCVFPDSRESLRGCSSNKSAFIHASLSLSAL